jgi:nitroreductase
MELLTVVRDRRAVREFRPEPIAPELIEQLVGVAVLAPSAMNLQPWEFAVIRDAVRIDEYALRAKQHLLTGSPPLPARAREMLDAPDFSIFYHAPVLLLVLATSADEQAREDCCLAAQTLMLAARDVQLGTCWIGLGRPWLDLPEIKAELGVPRDLHVVAPIVMGYPVAWPHSHGRTAPRIHWID